MVLRHLTDFPLARQGCEDFSSQVPAYAAPAVLLENEELVHPVGVRADLGCPVNQREAGVAIRNGSDVRSTVLVGPEAVERVSVLAMDVEVLVPYV